ncbi:MAG: glycosyl transferase [Clostridia bacterium]|nr:glycosyl transferase [Clostridia bacterium]
MKKLLKAASRILPDKIYIALKYRMRLGRFPNLKNPQTFSEKLQWLKLHDRRPEYTQMVDKYEAKKYIAEKIGEEYIIPTLGVWDNFDDIDFDQLPEQFVLKTTHDSGGVVICRDKSKLDLVAAKKKINESLKTNYYWQGREWPYKNVKPRILAEELLVEKSDDGEESVTDYKFFCFNGTPRIMFISKDNAENTYRDFFDMDFNEVNLRMKAERSPTPLKKPIAFERMKYIAKEISRDIPCIRVDFYFVEGNLYLGELTLFHNGGFFNGEPKEWDYTLGSWIELPKK